MLKIIRNLIDDDGIYFYDKSELQTVTRQFDDFSLICEAAGDKSLVEVGFAKVRFSCNKRPLAEETAFVRYVCSGRG